MLLIYSFQACMLIIALGVIALPFVRTQQSLLTKNYLIIGLLFITLVFFLDERSNNHTALRAWLDGGQQHYQLLETFTDLGGVDGAIASIQKKLSSNPNDTNGWFILGKLYLSKRNVIAAHDAFAKAHSLAPQDKEISIFFEQTR